MARPAGWQLLTAALVSACAFGGLLTVAKIAGAETSGAYFKEEFAGNALEGNRWAGFENNYPVQGIAVSGGFLELGQANTASLDFPYVASIASPFPSVEPFDVEFAVQFTLAAGQGTAVAVIGPSNEHIFSVWEDSFDGLRFYVGDGTTSTPISVPLGSHNYRLRFVQGAVVVFVDGLKLVTAPTSAMPSGVWFGTPTLGQVLFHPNVGYTQADPLTGLVSQRWWGTAQWTTLRIDYVRVSPLSVGGIAGLPVDPDAASLSAGDSSSLNAGFVAGGAAAAAGLAAAGSVVWCLRRRFTR